MSSDATRTKAAIQARRNNTEQMLQRVRDALRQMRRDHIPAQPAMVARRAEVEEGHPLAPRQWTTADLEANVTAAPDTARG